MPRQLNTRLKSLQECCINNVVNNIDRWCNKYTEKYGASKLDHLDVDGPFDSLPSTFLEHIIDILWRERLLKRHHLEFLVTPALKTLDVRTLDGCLDQEDILGVSGFLHLGFVRYPNLQVLKWPKYYQKPIGLLQIYLPMFQKLQELHIAYTETRNSCLHILGANCKELRILDAEGCSGVTDVGIKGLCVAIFDELGREIQTLGQCSNQ